MVGHNHDKRTVPARRGGKAVDKRGNGIVRVSESIEAFIREIAMEWYLERLVAAGCLHHAETGSGDGVRGILSNDVSEKSMVVRTPFAGFLAYAEILVTDYVAESAVYQISQHICEIDVTAIIVCAIVPRLT